MTSMLKSKNQLRVEALEIRHLLGAISDYTESEEFYAELNKVTDLAYDFSVHWSLCFASVSVASIPAFQGPSSHHWGRAENFLGPLKHDLIGAAYCGLSACVSTAVGETNPGTMAFHAVAHIGATSLVASLSK